MKSKRTLVAVAAFSLALTTLYSCKETGTSGIPIDRDRAKKHLISLTLADSYRNDFGKTKEALRSQVKDSSFLNKEFDMPIAEMFNRDAIALLLNQPGADGIRIYLGRDAKGKVRMVLLPVDKNGKDIRRKLLDALTQKAAAQPLDPGDGGDGDGGAVEVGQRCPDLCD
jgi:hypothetical protein